MPQSFPLQFSVPNEVRVIIRIFGVLALSSERIQTMSERVFCSQTWETTILPFRTFQVGESCRR
jgi:hypothetical protein